MKTITVGTQKGGTGKTTTVVALATGLTRRGYKVLVIDLDAQGNLSQTALTQTPKYNALDLINGKARARDVILESGEGYSIIPSSKELASVSKTALPKALEPIRNMFDVCIIDTAPALDSLTVNALASSDYVIIPSRLDRYSLNALTDFAITVAEVKKLNPKLKLGGILITHYNSRTGLSQLMLPQFEEKAKELKCKVYDTPIRKSVTLEEAQYLGNIYTYKPNGNASKDYNALVDQLIMDLKL